MNPNQSSIDDSELTPNEPPIRRWRNFAIRCGVLGALFPFSYGALMIYSVWSQPPLPQGYGSCGMPAVGGFFLIVVGCPVVGLMFAGLGLAIRGIFDHV